MTQTVEHPVTGEPVEIPTEILAQRQRNLGGQPYRLWVEGKKVLQWKSYTTCSRCGGKGGWEGWPGFTCFRCGGSGTDPTPVRLLTDEQAAKARARALLRQEKRTQEADADRLANVEDLPILPDIWKAADAEYDLETANQRIPDPMPGFVRDVALKARHTRLTDKQISAVAEAWERHLARTAERQAERESAEPCPTEKAAVVEGVVLKAEWRESQYGSTLKMVVKDDRGFRVWATCPKSINVHSDELPGTRIRFVADLEQSNDDPCFGFATRPRKGEVLELSE